MQIKNGGVKPLLQRRMVIFWCFEGDVGVTGSNLGNVGGDVGVCFA
jgi:hypothetical protein